MIQTSHDKRRFSETQPKLLISYNRSKWSNICEHVRKKQFFKEAIWKVYEDTHVLHAKTQFDKNNLQIWPLKIVELNGATSIIPGSCDDPNVLASNLRWASAVDRNVDVSTPREEQRLHQGNPGFGGSNGPFTNHFGTVPCILTRRYIYYKVGPETIGFKWTCKW